MIKCWDEQPQNRPSFTELRSKFDGMLTADNQDNSYIDFHRIDPTNLCYLPPQMLETGEAHTSMLSLKSGHHDDGITRSATSLKEMLSKSETNIHFQSPGHKLYSSQSADQMQQAKQVASAASSSEAEVDQLLNVNRGRPVSMYISSDEAKKERENPYVDEPSNFKSEASNSMLQSSTSPQRLGTKETIEMKHLSVNVESHCSNRDLECPEIKICPSEDIN